MSAVMKTPVRSKRRHEDAQAERQSALARAASETPEPEKGERAASHPPEPENPQPSASQTEEPEEGERAAAPRRVLSDKKGISRTALNFWVDFGMLILLCNTMWIAGVVFFVFPAPSEAAGWSVFGYGFDEWSFALLLSFSAFCLGVLVHLILHWTWILGVITSRLSRWKGERVALNESAKTLYGVGSMIVVLTILAILILAAEFSAKGP